MTLVSLAGCYDGTVGGPRPSAADGSTLILECADSAPADDWVCPAPFAIACQDLDTGTFLVQSPAGTSCRPQRLELSGALTPGKHSISLRDADSGDALCSTEVTVVAPDLQLEPHVLQLWPPNHKLHEIAVEDCVSVIDACGTGDVLAEFTWASSDEPVDAKGDGHHAPDILLSDDCQHVALRSERQGGSDGRVYKLGVRVTDRAGRSSDAVCQVIVDHDQRGVLGADSGEAYRVVFDGLDGTPVCDGSEPPILPPPASVPQLDATR